MVVVYDSLQLAHKCILNSFYGYVMRKVKLPSDTSRADRAVRAWCVVPGLWCCNSACCVLTR